MILPSHIDKTSSVPSFPVSAHSKYAKGGENREATKEKRENWGRKSIFVYLISEIRSLSKICSLLASVIAIFLKIFNKFPQKSEEEKMFETKKSRGKWGKGNFVTQFSPKKYFQRFFSFEQSIKKQCRLNFIPINHLQSNLRQWWYSQLQLNLCLAERIFKFRESPPKTGWHQHWRHREREQYYVWIVFEGFHKGELLVVASCGTLKFKIKSHKFWLPSTSTFRFEPNFSHNFLSLFELLLNIASDKTSLLIFMIWWWYISYILLISCMLSTQSN